ncbi:MAG: hypothetical protein E7214_04055 [Clostridium sp.]|nr:hypothetical protein [Clostridium sp.]
MKKYLLSNILINLVLLLYGCNYLETNYTSTSVDYKLEQDTYHSPPVKLDTYSLITEQTFNVSLENLGKVTFASYAPNRPDIIPEGSKEHPDVSFKLFKEGKVIYSFDTPKEIFSALQLWIYDRINFITFEDVNNDEIKDIIVNINYYVENGPSAFQPFSTTRIYLAQGNEFILDEELAEKIPYKLEDADSIVNYIRKTYSKRK